MELKEYWQIVRGARDAKDADRLFFRRWGYHPKEILSWGAVYYAGPLAPEDVENVDGPLLGSRCDWPCSMAKCA